MIRAITREVRDLDRDVNDILELLPSGFVPEDDPTTAYQLLVHHLCMRRNKRCLLAYHKVRINKIENLCWTGTDISEWNRVPSEIAGDVIDENQSKEGGMGTVNGEVGNSLSPEEEEFARQYSDLLAAYKGQWTDIDLTGSLEPPRDLFIDVRVLQDAGEIQTEYGAITLTKNSQFYVRQGDVERLVAQGFLQKLS